MVGTNPIRIPRPRAWRANFCMLRAVLTIFTCLIYPANRIKNREKRPMSLSDREFGLPAPCLAEFFRIRSCFWV
jgi:hypothetical protein